MDHCITQNLDLQEMGHVEWRMGRVSTRTCLSVGGTSLVNTMALKNRRPVLSSPSHVGIHDVGTDIPLKIHAPCPRSSRAAPIPAFARTSCSGWSQALSFFHHTPYENASSPCTPQQTILLLIQVHGQVSSTTNIHRQTSCEAHSDTVFPSCVCCEPKALPQKSRRE